ncbi:MAG: hypothetical protein RRY12_08200 [Cloacibacillus sp.]
MTRTKKTFISALASILNFAISAMSALILARIMMLRLGSDYNGLNAIVTQFLSIITLIEGGFTTASLVALFSPFTQGNIKRMNEILAESSYKFKKIALWSLLVGTVGAIVYGAFIQTKISYVTIVAVLLISLLSTVFQLFYTTRFRLLFQVAQDEYVYTFVMMCTNLICQISMIVLLYNTGNIILIRCVYLLFTCVAGWATKMCYNRLYPYATQLEKWDGVSYIFGTTDVMVGKIVSVVYSSSSILFISIFSNTAMASVYSVYFSIISMPSSIINIFISAPQNALGQILHEGNPAKIILIMNEFEFLVILLLTILFAPLGAVILPFMSVYTQGITDVQYLNTRLALLLILIAYTQLIHIPSGLCLIMGGHFKTARNIQLITLIILTVGNITCGITWSFYGILTNTLFCNLMLASMEIVYVHVKLLPGTLKCFSTMFIPNMFLTLFLSILFSPVALRYIHGYLSFCIVSSLLTGIACLIVLFFNFVFMRSQLLGIYKRLCSVF